MHSSKISPLLKCIVRCSTPEVVIPDIVNIRVKLHLMWMQCQCMRETDLCSETPCEGIGSLHEQRYFWLSSSACRLGGGPFSWQRTQGSRGQCSKHLGTIRSGQIIATSQDLTQKGKWWRESPLFQESQRLLKYMCYIYRYFSLACRIYRTYLRTFTYIWDTHTYIYTHTYDYKTIYIYNSTY